MLKHITKGELSFAREDFFQKNGEILAFLADVWYGGVSKLGKRRGIAVSGTWVGL